ILLCFPALLGRTTGARSLQAPAEGWGRIRLLPDDDGPGTHGPLFHQTVGHVGIAAGEFFGGGKVRAAENDQRGIGGVGKGSGKDDFSASVGFGGEAQMFVAEGRAACDEVVDDFVDQGEVRHRAAPARSFSDGRLSVNYLRRLPVVKYWKLTTGAAGDGGDEQDVVAVLD